MGPPWWERRFASCGVGEGIREGNNLQPHANTAPPAPQEFNMDAPYSWSEVFVLSVLFIVVGAVIIAAIIFG